MAISSASALAARVESDPELQAQIKSDPVAAINSLVSSPLESDVWIYRVIVGALSFVVVVSVLGAVILALKSLDVPDALVALGSAAVGALAGLLAPSPRQ